VSIKIYRPVGSAGVLPVLLFTHGAGWVFGDAYTHDRLVRELTVRAGVATGVSAETSRALAYGVSGVWPGHA
jgi:acetyl esterase/lipase